VHDHVRSLRLRHEPGHVRVGQPAADVVHQGGSGVQGGFRDGRPHGVHADEGAGADEGGDDRDYPAQFLFGADPLGTRAGGFTADVDDVRALGDELQAMGDRGARVLPLTAVGERVGRDVDHSHHQAPAGGLEGER